MRFCIATVIFAWTATAVMAAPPTWDWQLSNPVTDLSHKLGWYDIDPDGRDAAGIAAIKAGGAKTICYISVGTVEDYRNDVASFPPAVVGKIYGDWPHEKFLDIRQLDIVLPILKARFQRCANLGFDAVEPDNMDGYTNDSGFPITDDEEVAYVFALADLAHGMGMLIGQKNVSELTSQLIGKLDFVITEDCFMDGWCADVQAYAMAGKPVFAAEYTDTTVDFKAACAWGAAHGYSFILKDRDLSASFAACD